MDPFKIKSRIKDTSERDVIIPPAKVAKAVDDMCNALTQVKFFSEEAANHKEVVMDFALGEYAERLFRDTPYGFKLEGSSRRAMYVVQDASASLSQEDHAEFTARWGKKAAKTLIERDLGSIRFNTKVLTENYDAVIGALQTLPREVVDNLFMPLSLKAVEDAAQAARGYVKTPEDLRAILTDLKLRSYLRSV